MSEGRLLRDLIIEFHADGRWCEFGPNSTAAHCDGTCRELAGMALRVICEWLEWETKGIQS